MAENKTRPTDQSPQDFIAGLDNPARQADAERLLEIFGSVTNLAPRMWGPSIIGYGRYRYTYESGRTGEFMLTGFSPRKANHSIYIMSGYDGLEDELSRLGKHKTGKSCLYINKLADIDEDVLADMIGHGIHYMRAKYETWEA